MRRDDLPYMVEVELLRTEDGAVHPVGVSVRVMAPHPFPTGENVDLPPLSSRVVRRLPLASYLDAAVAWASHPVFVLRNLADPDAAWEEVRRAVAPRGRPAHNTNFYAELAEMFRALTLQGKRPVPEIARRKKVSANTVHQWIFGLVSLGFWISLLGGSEMRGHIIERRLGVSRVHSLRRIDSDAGRRRRITRTVAGSKRDAQRELTKMLRDRDQGTLADGHQSLEGYLEEWLAGVTAVSKRGRPLAPTTRQRYREACRHVSGVIGSVRLSDLRPAHVESVRDRLLAKARLAPQTVSDVLRVLSQALSRAEARGLVGRNPADPSLVHRPSGDRATFQVIDAALGSRSSR